MLYIVGTLIGVVLFIALAYRKTYSGLFYLICLGFLLVICSHLFESLTNTFTDIEFQTTGILYNPYDELVFALGNIRFGYTEVYAINSIGNMLFFMTIPMIIKTYIIEKKFRSRGEALASLLPYALIPACNALFYSANFSRWLFDYYQTSREYAMTASILTDLDILLNVILVGSIVISIVRLYCYYTRCRSIWMRSKTRANLVSLSALCGCFFYIYYGASKRFYFNSVSVPRTLISNAISAQPIITYESEPMLLIIALLMVVFAVQIRFQFILLPKRLEKYLHPSSSYIFNHRLQMVLHSLKNSVFSQQLVIDKIMHTSDPEEQKAALNNLSTITQKELAEITHYLDVSRSITYQSSIADVESCISKAWEMISPPADIGMELVCRADTRWVRFQERDLIEVFTNLMQNSIAAIRKAERAQGKIDITIFTEHSQIIVHFRDNGVGMDRKTRRKIFDSYFSTNTTGKNWGLGLTFVKNTVRIQRGEVYVVSAPGEGSMFELVLPVVEEVSYGAY